MPLYWPRYLLFCKTIHVENPLIPSFLMSQVSPAGAIRRGGESSGRRVPGDDKGQPTSERERGNIELGGLSPIFKVP